MVTLRESAPVENAADTLCEAGKVAAVEADAADRDSRRLQSWCERDHLPGRGLGVVGVEEKSEAFRPCLGKMLEGGGFVVMRLDEGMRHGAEGRDAEQPLGLDRGGAGESDEVAGACGEHARLRAVGAAEAEIDEEPALRGKHHARRLGGDQRLEVEEIHDPRLDELGERQRRGDAEDRLVGEEESALRHGVDVAGEAEAGEIVDKAPREPAGRGEPVEIALREVEVFEEGEHLVETGGDQKTALARQPPHEELEHRRLGLAMGEIRFHHVELIEIGHQGVSREIHLCPSPSSPSVGTVQRQLNKHTSPPSDNFAVLSQGRRPALTGIKAGRRQALTMGR